MRKLLLALAITSLLAAGGAATIALAATKTVKLGDNFFFTGKVTIKRGSAVRWTWSGTQNAHNVSSKKGDRFRSATGKSGSFTHVFRTRGTFTIICTKHPSQMRMVVKVV